MREEDKTRIREAWLQAVSENPEADSPVEGMVTGNGDPLTLRDLVNKVINDEAVYENWSRLIDNGVTSVEEIIEDLGRQYGPK